MLHSKILGMEDSTFNGDQKALWFGDWKFNLQKMEKECDPKAAQLEGSQDVCPTTDVPLEKAIEQLRLVMSLLRRTQPPEQEQRAYLLCPSTVSWQNLTEVSSYAPL